MGYTEDAVLQLFDQLATSQPHPSGTTTAATSPSSKASTLPPCSPCSDKKLSKHEAQYKPDFWTKHKDDGIRQYAADGEPVVFAMRGNGGVRVCMLRWATACRQEGREESVKSLGGAGVLVSENYAPVNWSETKGAVFLVHGVTSHSRFEWLRLATVDHCGVSLMTERDLTQDEQKKLLEAVVSAPEPQHVYHDSWVEKMNAGGWAVYAMEAQGHGLSDGWEGQRCVAQQLADIYNDLIRWLELMRLTGEVKPSKPLYVAGLSLGGCIVARALITGFQSKRLVSHAPQDDESSLPVNVHGCILIAPALSTEKLKEKTANRVALPFAGIISKIAPHAKVGRVEENHAHPFVREAVSRDAWIFHDHIPARLSGDIIEEMDQIVPNIKELPQEMRLYVIHSKKDTMTDFNSSCLLFQDSNCTDKKMDEMSFMWHFLSKEPGNGQMIENILSWLAV